MAESYIVFGHFCPVHHTCSAFPTHLPEPELSEESKDEKKKNNDDDYDKKDICVPMSWQCDESSESSDMDSI